MKMSISLFLLVCLSGMVSGHGYLQKPPARNCMWRFGFDNPKNYNDNENFCGGATRMNELGGKCGVCGDEWGKKEQPHDDGGRYANNIIVANYKPGQTVDIETLLTLSHLGHFEFRINDFTNKKTEGDAVGKLKGYLLPVSTGGTKYPVTKDGKYLYKFKVILPPTLTCKRCVLQWWYRGGNNWGCDKSGCGLGHGAQEHFVNCADVSIGGSSPPNPQTRPPKPPTKRPQPPTIGLVTRPPITCTHVTKRPPVTKQPSGLWKCTATGSFANNPGMIRTCKRRCSWLTGKCPSRLPCKCTK